MYVSSVTFFIRFWQSVHPSELSIMGPLGSCGIPALWSHLRSWREWGLLGGRKNRNADLLHSTRTPPLFKRQSDVNYAHRTPIERYGVAGAAKSSLANLRMWRCASVCVFYYLCNLGVWMQCFSLPRGEICLSAWTSSLEKVHNVFFLMK